MILSMFFILPRNLFLSMLFYFANNEMNQSYMDNTFNCILCKNNPFNNSSEGHNVPVTSENDS